jgi:hypothetical protein
MPGLVDDLTIKYDALLWRRIIIDPSWIKREADGSERPASIAFRDRIDNEVSIHIAELTTAATILQKYPGIRLAEITAAMIRELALCGIARKPEPDDPSHAVFFPSPNDTRARKLAKAAKWVEP